MAALGSSVEGRPSRADAVSGDGRVVVGYQELSNSLRQGARWVDGRQALMAGPRGCGRWAGAPPRGERTPRPPPAPAGGPRAPRGSGGGRPPRATTAASSGEGR